MPVMSAEARESTIAAAIDVRGSQADSPRASSPATAPTSAVPPSAKPITIASTWRMMFLGYFLLIAGTVLTMVIPSFRLHPGLTEAAIVLTCIVSILAGVFLAIWAFVWPLLRQE